MNVGAVVTAILVGCHRPAAPQSARGPAGRKTDYEVMMEQHARVKALDVEGTPGPGHDGGCRA